MKTKKVTIDDLAIMVQHGFMDVHKRFEDIDKRFENIDRRFNDMDNRFDRLEKRFDKLEDIVLSDHRPRIRILEKDLGK